MTHSSISAYFMSGATFMISLFRPEEWMAIGIIVGIIGTIFTTWANWYWKKRSVEEIRSRVARMAFKRGYAKGRASRTDQQL